MATKVRIEGVTIETSGELERVLLERVLEYLMSRHPSTVVTPLSEDEIKAVREALKQDVDDVPANSGTRDIDRSIEDFARRHAEADRKARQTVSRPSQYPRVGVTGEKIEGPRTGATIGEMLAASGRIPENWMTRRKAHYWCSECGNEGTRYIYPDWAFVRCQNCDARLKVEPVNADGTPDESGNYFVARELFDGNAAAVETTSEPDSGTQNETANGAVEEAQAGG